MTSPITTLPEHIASKIAPMVDGCWLWTASLDSGGHGHLYLDGRFQMAHRVVYEYLVGPIDAETLDHLCRVRSCVNPGHLEPVSLRENILRGVGPSTLNAVKTHCPKGHEYDEANTYRLPSSGGRICRKCKRLDDTRRRKEAKARGDCTRCCCRPAEPGFAQCSSCRAYRRPRYPCEREDEE